MSEISIFKNKLIDLSTRLDGIYETMENKGYEMSDTHNIVNLSNSVTNMQHKQELTTITKSYTANGSKTISADENKPFSSVTVNINVPTTTMSTLDKTLSSNEKYTFKPSSTNTAYNEVNITVNVPTNSFVDLSVSTTLLPYDSGGNLDLDNIISCISNAATNFSHNQFKIYNILISIFYLMSIDGEHSAEYEIEVEDATSGVSVLTSIYNFILNYKNYNTLFGDKLDDIKSAINDYLVNNVLNTNNYTKLVQTLNIDESTLFTFNNSEAVLIYDDVLVLNIQNIINNYSLLPAEYFQEISIFDFIIEMLDTNNYSFDNTLSSMVECFYIQQTE